MIVKNKTFDYFSKPFVLDNENRVIAAADTHLAKCIGENANWQPMRTFKFSPSWTGGIGIGDRYCHILGTNPFTDMGSFQPQPSEMRKFFIGERFNHQTRAFSFLNPSRLQEGINILGVTELNFDLVTMWFTPKRIDRAVLYVLSIVSQAGWKVDETFVRFNVASKMATPGSKMQGVILGSCKNWLEALLCATLISAGYFVMCYDEQSSPSHYYPANMDLVRFGIHPLYFGKGIRSHSYVYVDDICLSPTTAVLDENNPDSKPVLILSRAKKEDEPLAHCGLYPFGRPAKGEIKKLDEDVGGTNLAVDFMPSIKQYDALEQSDKEYFEDGVHDAANLVNFSLGEIFGFGLNEFDPGVDYHDFGYQNVRAITNDAFDEDVSAGNLYDDVTKYSVEGVVRL